MTGIAPCGPLRWRRNAKPESAGPSTTGAGKKPFFRRCAEPVETGLAPSPPDTGDAAKETRQAASPPGGVWYIGVSRRFPMSRNVRCGLIQASNALNSRSLPQVKKAMIDKHLKLIEQAARKKVKVLCLQELFYGPYFCAEQDIRWYDLTERVPDAPTTKLMQKIAAKHNMVIVVPVYEEQIPGLYFNTAAVIDADGKYLGKYRKHHIPHVHPGFWEKFYFTPGDMGYPVFETK